MSEENKKCCICGKHFSGWGNDPWPVNMNSGTVCCDECNYNVVIPARIAALHKKEEK